MEEIWKDIEGYEGLYQVSTMGRVRSLDLLKHFYPRDRKAYQKVLKGKVLKPHFRSEFMFSLLYRNGEFEYKSIHHLVANAFLENPMNYKYIKFKDGDKSNVRLDNLVWSTK